MSRQIKKASRTMFMLVLAASAGRLTGHCIAARFSQTQGDSALALNAAFRKGLYLGKLALHGRRVHLSIGRWNSGEDRAWFASGYRQGYASARRHGSRASQPTTE